MSFKSTIRKINAANKRAIRESERRRRELQRRQREVQKLQEFEAARLEVEIYENRVEVLKSIHKDCSETFNWELIKSEDPPFLPGETGHYEKEAREKLRNYKPGILDKMFNRSEVRKKLLEQEIQKAKEVDQQEYKNWQERIQLAKDVLTGDKDTYIRIIEELAPLNDINEIGSSISFSVLDSKTIEASVSVHSEDVIPNTIKSLTSTGKLSSKKMPKGQYNELYQDYVCGVVLRIARELFALLPIEVVYIHALADLLNTSTGHLEEQPILSVMIPRKTLERLNFDLIDCSDSMTNFKHNMQFSKTSGFKPVERITTA